MDYNFDFIMDYNFKVGDRVSTRSGAWGTLVKDHDGDWAWVCCHSTEFFKPGAIYDVFDENEPYSYFESIGEYDFTKLQKIEKIKDCVLLNLKECQYTDQRLVEKINELVDHVNKLEESK